MDTTETYLRHLSSKELAALGMDHMAYIKAVLHNGNTSYAIHAADGTPLTVMGELETAIAAIRQHDLEPVRVH